MAGYTEFLKLFKYDPTTDGNNVFSINQALNENWDKLDAAVENMSSRKIGEIITSTIPIIDAGIHLLDGALIQGNGIYKDFVDYMANLYGDGTNIPNYFCSEEDWQTSVTTYGVCGKFVFTPASGNTPTTVRLPKITGIIEGTTDTTALGELQEAYVKLPNITGTWGGAPSAYVSQYGTGAITWSSVGGNYGYNTGGGGGSGFSFDASKCSDVYSGDGTDTVVHPQTIELLFYIVIAETANTQIQVDINQIASDLNDKVSISDCQEVQCVVETYQNGTSWYRIYSDGWCEQGGVAYCTVATTTTVSLLKNYINTNYSVLLEPNKDATDIWGHGDTVPPSSITTSSFGIYIHSSGGSYNIFWRACGYIA